MIIGALLIGQSPRPDLVDPLQAALPGARIIEIGALDELHRGNLPSTGQSLFPLVTKMRDGTSVTVDHFFLEPLLQTALEQMESEGASASILLCAGTFATLSGRKPLVKPFDAARNHLQAAGIERLGLIAPIPDQVAPLQARWRAAGFNSVAWAADVARPDDRFTRLLKNQVRAYRLEAILLDYVGHPALLVERVAAAAPVPLFDSGRLAIEALATLV